ncbi:hypothetical protein Hanom_Chr08g00723931 [Helianthus anomalus]
MPMVWRVLATLEQIKARHMPDLCIEDLPMAYCLRSHGSSRFLLFSISKNPLILKATKNEDKWTRKFFFVKRDSIDRGSDLPKRWLTSANFKELAPPSAESVERIKEIYKLPESERTFTLMFTRSSQRSSSNMSGKYTYLIKLTIFQKRNEINRFFPYTMPVINLEGFQLDELDNYSSLAPIKQESNPKSSVTPKATSSKTIAAPKAPPASRTRASSSRKRKEADPPTTPHIFPFENHGFTDSGKFMTSFLNPVSILTYILHHMLITNVNLD